MFSQYATAFKVCVSPAEWKVSKGASKLKIKVLGADRISMLQFCNTPAKRIQIKLYEAHLGKEKPVMGNIEFLLGITKPAEGWNKPCQGNLNGKKSFAAEGFNVKIPFIIRKLWQFPSDKVILELVILLNITQGSFLDGIHQIAKLTGYAAEVLRTLSSRHRIYTVYFAILL